MIKTWRQRCEEHPDHNGIVSDGMIQARMQEEIDELRDAIKSPTGTWWDEPVAQMNYRKWQGLTADEIWDAWCEQAKPERDTRNFVAAFARAIEAKLQERNT